jgi:hypothetical protein
MHHQLYAHVLWVVCNWQTLKLRPGQRLGKLFINMYRITVKGLISLLLHCISVSLVLTSLYVYNLHIGLSKVKNSHHLRDLDSLLTISLSFSSLKIQNNITLCSAFCSQSLQPCPLPLAKYSYHVVRFLCYSTLLRDDAEQSCTAGIFGSSRKKTI